MRHELDDDLTKNRQKRKNKKKADFAFSDVAMHDDTSTPALALQFSIGNVVIYKTELINGWTKGEFVVIVNQHLKSDNQQGIYIAYLVWSHRRCPTKNKGWNMSMKTYSFIRPRPDYLIPNPTKLKPFTEMMLNLFGMSKQLLLGSHNIAITA